MRFSVVLATLPLLVAAGPIVSRADGGSCNTGPIQCCNSVQQTSDPVTSLLQGLLGISLGSITGLIGLNCSPLTIIGAGGNSCSAQPVCCSNNSFGGLISLGCNPINLNL